MTSVLREHNAGIWLYFSTERGGVDAKLGNSLPRGGGGGGFATQGNANQEGGLPGALAALEVVDAAIWRWWGGAMNSGLTEGVPS